MSGTTPEEVRGGFRDAVNMTAGQLEQWLASEESRSVGWTGSAADGERKASPGGPESTGHESGRHIVALLRADGEPDEDDLAHLREVVGYVHRHLAQRPTKEEIATSRWRYSLMNWGHDPLQG